MRTITLLLILTCLFPLCTRADADEGGVRRFALVTGANFGGTDRTELKYAVSDAKGFSRVLVSLGGVDPADAILLEQPSIGELEGALQELHARVASVRRHAGLHRTEVLVYYSGHADDKGLLLGEDRYSYRTLRGHLEEIPADVRLAVLDACASGAITRLKGGTQRKPFLVDASSDMRGHAFLTSSSLDEAAQESDHIGGSFFTHYLISGLRGAADVSGEGKVTLNEAYQFAYNETLGRTADTKGGAQHPNYDINLSGTGDVVITDLRQTSAGLVLAEDIAGRCFVRDSEGRLVVELAKARGRRVELGLEPGDYEVHCQERPSAMVSKVRLSEGTEVTLASGDFEPTEPEEAVSRGGDRGPRIGELNGRHRIDLRISYWDQPGFSSGQAGLVSVEVGQLAGGIGYTYWLAPEWAATFALTSLASDVRVGFEGSDVSSLSSVLVGVRRDFILKTQPALRPYLAASLGPYIASGVTSGGLIGSSVRTQTTFGGHAGGGLDMQLARWFSLGIRAGYNFMGGFSEPLGGETNFSGFEAGVSIGFLFGKGRR